MFSLLTGMFDIAVLLYNYITMGWLIIGEEYIRSGEVWSKVNFT